MSVDYNDVEIRTHLKSLLCESVGQVVFTKVDGTERTMNCTLDAKVIPPVVIDIESTVKKRSENDNVLCVWDVDASGWRSFRWDSIKTFEVEI